MQASWLMAGDATRRTASSLNKPNFRLDPITPLTGLTSPRSDILPSEHRCPCNSFYIFTCYLERGKSKRGANIIWFAFDPPISSSSFPLLFSFLSFCLRNCGFNMVHVYGFQITNVFDRQIRFAHRYRDISRG